MTTEILTPENFFQRMRELKEAGAVIFRMSRGDTNSRWEIQWYEAEAPRIGQQQEMKLNPSELF